MKMTSHLQKTHSYSDVKCCISLLFHFHDAEFVALGGMLQWGK